MLRIVWTYVVKPEPKEEFVRNYSSEGTWAVFFRRDPAYRGTVLWHDSGSPNRFLTVDTWDDQESYDRFTATHAVEYRDLDQQLDALTVSETFVGNFSDFEQL